MSYESCSCKMVCPCTLGPAEPDQGWCSGAFDFDIQGGESNGVDLAGTRAALHFELQGDFISDIDKARVYVDESASQEQRDELSAVFRGERGGLWEGVAGMVAEFLPTQTAPISIEDGDDAPTVKVGDGVQFSLQRIKTEDGRQAKLLKAPVAAGFFVDTIELANATGGASDPDLRAWETGGYGGTFPFNWSF